MARSSPNIPDSELDVLTVLWDQKSGTVREILDSLHKRGSDWSYATVATLLDRLERKQYVTSNRDDLAYIYSPLIPPDEVRHKRLSNVIEKLFSNNPSELVVHVLKTYRMKSDELEEIKETLDRNSRRRTRATVTRK